MHSKSKSIFVFRWKNILKSKHFRSVFRIIMIFTTVFFLIGGVFITLQNGMKIRKTMELKTSHTAISVQNLLNSIGSSAVFVGSMPSVGQLIQTRNPTLDQFSRMIDDVEPYSSLYQYESITVFFDSAKRIYDSAGGLYHYDDFYNPKLLKQLDAMQTEDMWLINTPYTRYYEPRPAVPVISYVRRLPLYETVHTGYISVSYSMENLRQMAKTSDTYEPYTAAVYFKDRLLWCSSSDVTEQWDDSLPVSDNETKIFGSAKKYASLSNVGSTCACYITNTELFHTLLPDLLRWAGLYCAAVLVVFLISAGYSAVMLRPIDTLMQRIGTTPYTENSDAQADEFALIGTAFDSLSSQLENIQDVMHENQQLVRERLLLGILYNYVDIRHLSPPYEENGIRFPHPYLSIILIAIPSLSEITDYTRQEQLKLVVRNNAAAAFSSLGAAYSLYMENKSICILLNSRHTENLQSELTKICTVLKSSMKQTLSLYPLFSVCFCSSNDPRPYEAWQLAQKNFMFSAADADDFLQFSTQSESISSLDPDLLSGFCQCVVDKDMSGMQNLTDTFCQRYLSEGVALSEARRLTAIALGTVFTSLLEWNVPAQENHITIFISKISTAGSPAECGTHLLACLSALIDSDTKISEEAYGYVQKSMKYLKAHYAEQITIPQIAAFVGVSPIYLNKVFKLSTGKTLSEYLNYYRIQQSLDLLAGSDNTVSRISESVGYNDVRSYIRFFKKFYHTTPNEYRKSGRQ